MVESAWPPVSREGYLTYLFQNHCSLSSSGFGATEGVEGVIRGELPCHVLEVIVAGGLEPCGQSVEAGRLRRETALGSVGASHDEGEGTQGRIVQLVFLEECIERAVVAVMPQLHAGNIIGNCLLTLGDLHD